MIAPAEIREPDEIAEEEIFLKAWATFSTKVLTPEEWSENVRRLKNGKPYTFAFAPYQR